MKKSDFKRQGLATLKASARWTSEEQEAAGPATKTEFSSRFLRISKMFGWKIVNKGIIWQEQGAFFSYSDLRLIGVSVSAFRGAIKCY